MSTRFVLAFASCLLALIVASTGISSLLRAGAPHHALFFNRLDNEARLDHLVSALSRLTPGAETAGLRVEALQAIRHAPIDARGYSLLAEIHFMAGDTEAAERLFNHALAYSSTEIHALRRSLAYHVQRGEFTEALNRVDLIGRRWPDRFGIIEPYLAALLAQPRAYDRAIELLSLNPPWRGRFIRALAGRDGNLELAYRLQIDLSKSEDAIRPREIAATMHALIQAGRHDLAHRLFLFTQTENDRRIAGYVFNADFSAPPDPRPFDWTLNDNSSAQVTWRGDDVSGDGDVRIRFLGKPVRTVGIAQLLYLPTGKFRLSVEYSASGLEIPRRLYLNLQCGNRRQEVARIDFEPGNPSRRTASQDFVLEPGNCDLLRIGINTDLIAGSFLYRYQGTLILHSVRIARLAA